MRSIPEPWSRKCQSYEEIENTPRAKYSRDLMRPCHEVHSGLGPESRDLWAHCNVMYCRVSCHTSLGASLSGNNVQDGIQHNMDGLIGLCLTKRTRKGRLLYAITLSF